MGVLSAVGCFQGTEEVDTAPGAPQQRSQLEGHAHQAEMKELQRRSSASGTLLDYTRNI